MEDDGNNAILGEPEQPEQPEQPEKPEQPSVFSLPTNNDTRLNQLTLELLTNKGQYKKYLSKADPKKFQEQREHLEKISKYRYKIQNIINDLLENSEKSITTAVNESFDEFVKTCIRYLEMKEFENQYSYEKDEEDEEDVLFGNCEEDEPIVDSTSHWGKPVIKKSSTLPRYTMDMYSKKR
jgi:hypothetical protein